MIAAGRKDRKIIIERATSSQNAIGEPVESWATYKTLRAEVVPMGGKEVLSFDQITSAETARFITHYVSGVTVKDRISYDSKYWNIRALKELGRRRELEITAEAIE